MNVLHTNKLADSQKISVSLLWNQEYPEQLILEKLVDFESYLSNLDELDHFLYQEETGEILGWAFKFNRDSQKWFAIILDHNLQGRGIGSMLLHKLKENESELNGWVVDHNNYKKSNGKVYLSPLSFYLKNDFLPEPDTRLELSQISAMKITWSRA